MLSFPPFRFASSIRSSVFSFSESYRNQKNIITRAVGIGKRVEADFFEVPLLESDCVLLCSDGLTNMVDDAEISRVLKTTDTLKEKTDALIDEANRNGGKDNIAIFSRFRYLSSRKRS